MTNKTTVIYHSGDFDGEFCREIARFHLTNPANPAAGSLEIVTYIGWDYGDPKLDFPSEGNVFVLDLNPECFKEFPGIDVAKARCVWIDHHKTAIEKWGTYLPGYRIEGVAACRLAWQFFSIAPGAPVPVKEDFLTRKVEEPLAVLLAGEYDVADHRGDGDLEFQLGLRSQEEIPWELLLTDGDPQKRAPSEAYVARLIQAGRMVQTYVRKANAIKMKSAFLMKWQGVQFLCLNSAGRGSQNFESLDKPDTGHHALMLFHWTGNHWEFSLYHSKHRTDIDLTTVAKKYGGGGHPGACGFRTLQIPFPLYPICPTCS